MDFQSYAETHGEFVHWIAIQRSARRSLLRRISRPVARDTKRLLVRRFLLNADLRTYYLFRSARMKKCLNDWPPSALYEEGPALNPFEPVDEQVQAFIRRRHGSRRARRVFQFGPRRHALQSMVADVLAALHPPRPDQFTVRGGVRAALLAVQEAVQLERTHALERDIVGFYDNVKLDGLTSLLRPLPRGVIENVVWTRSEDISAGQPDVPIDEADLLAPLPPGGLLAQGAASSPIAAEIVVADLLREIPQDVSVSAYADNILLLGESEQSVMAADICLEDRARTSACGPLGLKPPIETNVGSGILQFLGHDGVLKGGGMEWTPAHQRLVAMENLIEKSDARLPQIHEAIASLTHWQRGYPLWSDGDSWARRLRTQLLGRAYFFEENAISRRTIEVRIVSEVRAALAAGECLSLVDFLPAPSAETVDRRNELVNFLRGVFPPTPVAANLVDVCCE